MLTCVFDLILSRTPAELFSLNYFLPLTTYLVDFSKKKNPVVKEFLRHKQLWHVDSLEIKREKRETLDISPANMSPFSNMSNGGNNQVEKKEFMAVVVPIRESSIGSNP